MFYVTTSGSFKRFQYFNFETNFLENDKLFLKNRNLVETTKIESTSCPLKTSLSEVNVKTNRMTTTKWTHHKEWSFASKYLIFLEFFFQFQNLFNRVNLMYQRPKCPYSYLLQALKLDFRVLFSL